MFVQKGLSRLGIVAVGQAIQLNQMEDEIVDDVGGNPGRAQSDVDTVGGNIRLDHLFQRADIIRKIAVVLLVGLLCQVELVQQVAGQILVGGFPPFIEALVPVEGVLIDGAAELLDHRGNFLTGDGGDELDVHDAQRIDGEQQGIRYAVAVNVGTVVLRIGVLKVQRQVHGRDLFHVLSVCGGGTLGGAAFGGDAALFLLGHFLFEQFGLFFFHLALLPFLDVQLGQFDGFHRNIQLFHRQDLGAGADTVIEVKQRLALFVGGVDFGGGRVLFIGHLRNSFHFSIYRVAKAMHRFWYIVFRYSCSSCTHIPNCS